jgi:signal transduction histidine kinase
VRRIAPEWLLVPVFALPLAAAGALVIWARHDYFAALRPFRDDGAALARRWIAADPARVAWAKQRFAESVRIPGAADAGWIAFRHGAASGFVRAEGAEGPRAPWFLATGFPAGLTSAALGDANVRLAVEAGTPQSAHAGADPGTAAFRAILETRDLDRLRTAPLPAATKLYLLRRVFDGGPPGIANALAALRAFDDAVATGRQPAPGVHVTGAAGILVTPGGTALVYPRAQDVRAPEPFTLAEDADGLMRLDWTPGTAPADDGAVWRARLAEPFAGEWVFVPVHGDRWWEGPAARWALPAAFACAAFLFVPAALFVAIRRRRRLDEARARFVNELAHDLRTPVTSLRLHAEMLAEGRVPAGEESRYLSVVGRETARLSSLLANLLDLARLDRGAREYAPQRLEVAEVLDDALRDFALVHPKRAADVFAENVNGLAVSADRTGVARCLANLLDNAGKFTSPGTAIRVTAGRTDAGGVRIVVADEGEGIAADERARVFGLYERGAAAARTGAPGTGLGLALVRELAEAMGGRVTLLDTPRGAAFEIVLPEAQHG